MPFSRFNAVPLKPMPAWVFNLVFAVLLASVYNVTVWQQVLRFYPPGHEKSWPFLLMLLVVMTGFFYLCTSLFTLVRAGRPVVVLVCILNAVVLYFMREYHVLIDDTMLENVWQTDIGEASELVTWQLLPYVACLGVLPAAILWKIPVIKIQGLKAHGRFMATMLVPVALIGVIGATHFQEFSSLVRNHKDLRYLVLPNNYVNAAYGNLKHHLPQTAKKAIAPQPAQKDASWAGHSKKTLFVFVVGETARADNFSLDGYDRETNPLLKKQDILNFTNMHSCGTSTAVSVPCMFSAGGRRGYDPAITNNPNNLFLLMGRAGFKTKWIDNNSGCKGLCTGGDVTQTRDLQKAYMQKGDTSEVYDTLMLPELDKFVAHNTDDAFVVLHQKGSHGPAYYLRTPESFWRYQPVCKTEELIHCTPDQIRNSFDNTILFTDSFLSQLIDRLKALSAEYNVAMLYVSDHGESLGEHNLYLHGLPYGIAPEQQKHVPFIVWLSPGFAAQAHLDEACLKARSATAFSQDNLFHSILDALSVDTSLKDEAQSIFKGCRH